MGSFNMNASFSKMPLRWNDDAVVIICLKRNYRGKKEYLPLSYPIFGKYFDYGWVHDFQENEITKAIYDFFGMNDINNIIDLIYEMTIHGDYKDGLEAIKNNTEPYNKEHFDKYIEILDKLRENSGVEIPTDEEILKYHEKHPLIGKHYKEERESLTKMLDSYELSLFYEHSKVWEALTGPQYTDLSGKTYCDYTISDDVSWFGNFREDKANLFCMTKNCTSPETVRLKEGLHGLYKNFAIEGKRFEFEETSQSYQDYCPCMWNRIGKALQEITENNCK